MVLDSGKILNAGPQTPAPHVAGRKLAEEMQEGQRRQGGHVCCSFPTCPFSSGHAQTFDILQLFGVSKFIAT